MSTRRALTFLVGLAMCVAACSSASDGKTAGSGPDATRPASAHASTGCRGAAPAPGRSEVVVPSGGRDRAYVRYVPTGLERAKPAPLVIDFTAYSPASLEEEFSGFTQPDADGDVMADEVGAVVVTPQPVNGKGLLTWNVDHTAGWTDDERFVGDLIDDVGAHACIDADRVLAMGFAIGAVMASTVACEQPARIAVLATVSGLWDPPDCTPSRRVPLVSFHGTDDHFLPFDGGVGDRIDRLGLTPETSAGLVAMASRPGAVAASTAWAARNDCDAQPERRVVNPTVSTVTWSGCAADVELHVVDGGGHTWPGSVGMAGYASLLGPVSQAVDANRLIWDFFEAHTRA